MTAKTFTDAEVRAVASRLRAAEGYDLPPGGLLEAADVIEALYRDRAHLTAMLQRVGVAYDQIGDAIREVAR